MIDVTLWSFDWNSLMTVDSFFLGNYENLLSSLSFSVTDTCSTLTRHSSYTWLHDEEEDTCLLATQLRRRYEEVRRSAIEQSGASIMEQEEIDDQVLNHVSQKICPFIIRESFSKMKFSPDTLYVWNLTLLFIKLMKKSLDFHQLRYTASIWLKPITIF